MDASLIEKFWKHVQKTDTCWNWTGNLSPDGSPIIRTGTRPNEQEYYPRRMSLQIHGKPLSKPVIVICKTKLCVNPEHLASGDEERFWAKVQKLSNEQGGCWVWTASHDKNMYGKFRLTINGKRIDKRAHQYSFELAHGITIKKLHVLHTCDHPYCVNPDHLFLGTIQDNQADKISKGRQVKGEKIHTAVLNEEQVRDMRRLRTEGTSVADIAVMFGVSNSTTRSVLSHETWKHVI